MRTKKYWVNVSRICRSRMLIWFSVLFAALLPAQTAAQIPTGYQEYYVLGYEAHVLDAYRKILDTSTPNSYICSVVTLVATADQQVVYYDHWEDGYEVDLRNHTQISTEIYTLSSGDILSLQSSADPTVGPPKNQCVPSDPRNSADVRYDGRDHIFTTGGPVALAHAMWVYDNTWIADAWENYPAQTYAGTYFYYTPVGEDLYTFGGGDTGTYGDFREVFLQVAAFERDTTVSVDNGVETVNFVLNQGDIYYSEGFINLGAAPAIVVNAGTTIRTSKPVQVGVMTGADRLGGNSGFQGRFYTLLPEPQWGADYTVLVPRTRATHPAEIYMANPNDYPITVQAYESGPTAATFSIASNQYLTATVPYLTARGAYAPANASVRLTSSDGVFGVLVAADTSQTHYDWGFAPVPNQYLMKNYYVSWAPGNAIGDDYNSAPVWVAPVSDGTTFYIDYGPNDGIVDRTFTLNALEQIRIFDPDKDNTGMHVWATHKFAIAWGMDTSRDDWSGGYCLDLGYTVLPVNEDWMDPAATFEKTADPVVLPPGGGVVTFTLVTQAYDVPLTQINISDTLPLRWSYVPNTTRINGSPGPNPSQTGQLLYWGLSENLAAHQSLTLIFQAQILNTAGITMSINRAQALTEDALYGDALNPADDAMVHINALQLTKAVNRTTVEIGQTLIYTLTYRNVSTQTLYDVLLQDVAPAYYVTFQGASNGGNFTDSSSMVRWRLNPPQLNPGESGYVTFTVRVKDFLANGTRIENTGYVYTDPVSLELPILVPSNVVRSVVQAPQISFLNSGPVVVSQGDLITYTLSYQNVGGMTANNVVVTNTIPALTDYVPNSMAFWNGTTWIPLTDIADGDIGRRIGNNLIVVPGNVAAGVSGKIRYVVQVPFSTPAGSDILNSAVLDRDLDIPRTSNIVVTRVSPLSIQKTAIPPVSAPDGLITYTLTYQNRSATVSQANVIIMDPVPTYTTFVVGSASGTPEYSENNGATWSSTPSPAVTHIRWPVLNLSPGASGTLTFAVQVQSTLPPSTTIWNTAYISSSELLEFGNIMLDSDPVDTPTVDLHIVKTAAPSTATAGEGVIAYTLTYSNSGSAEASSVQIFDRIPTGATYVAGSVGGAGADASTPPYLTWTLGTVPADLTNRQAWYQATLNPDFSAGVLTNTAAIRNALMSRSSVATVTVTTRADLQLSKSASPNPVALGAVLTYTLHYTNTGPSVAHDVVITDLLPSGVTFGVVVSASPGLSGPTQAGQLLSWTTSNLSPASPGAIVFTVTVNMDAGDQLVNTAGISGADPDPATGNNTDSETTTVYSSVDLTLQKSGSPGTVAPGGTLVYALVFTNPGPLVISSAVITDFVPSEVTISGVSTSGASIALVQTTPVYVWNITNFPVGGQGLIVLTASVQTGLAAGYRFTNTATLAAPLESQPADNTDAAVTLISNAAPVAVDDELSVAEDGITTTLLGGFTSVLHNDSDANNDLLTASVATAPLYGSLALAADGTFTYDHDGTETTGDSFVYEVCDTGTPALCDQATATITITPVNDAPVAVDDTATVAEGGAVTTLDGGATSVRDNDSDNETPAASLVVALVTGPVNGVLTLNSDGTFSYTHDGTETTSDSFVYEVCDTGTPALCDQATVTITIMAVNAPPVAVGDAATVAEGGTVTTLDGGATSVRDNDSDDETPAASLVVALVTGPANGALTLNPDGTFSYTHDGTETISDSFVYEVCDTGTPALCAQATVTIVIIPVNDSPVISSIGSLTIAMNSSSGPLPFTISDAEMPANMLVLTVTTSNPALIPESQIVLGGSDSARTLILTPLADTVGSTTITVQVGDGEIATGMSFGVTVLERIPHYLYLPAIARFDAAPDLIVSNLTVTPYDIIVEVKNIGTGEVPVQAFWVDVYVNPDIVPTHVNQVWWELGQEGLLWSVKTYALPIAPGGTVTLRIDDSHYWPDASRVYWPLAVGTQVYAQVDSANTESAFGAIIETHELQGEPYNNITSVQLTAAMYALTDTQRSRNTTTVSENVYSNRDGLPPRPPYTPPQTAPGPANTPPTISLLGAPKVVMSGNSGPSSFTISDVETPSEALILTVASSNPAPISGARFKFRTKCNLQKHAPGTKIGAFRVRRHSGSAP